MPDWTLEGELRKAARADNLEGALRALQLLSADDELARLVTLGEWVRGGAETFIFRFDVHTRLERVISAIIKAHTPPIGPRSVEESLGEMLKRRQLLAEHGINAPVLYYAGTGIIIEQFVPFSFTEQFSRTTPQAEEALHLATELVAISLVLDECGFAPVDFIEDLRVNHDRTVCAVDFGQDLGPPHVRPNKGENEATAKSWLRRHNVDWPDGVLRTGALALLAERRRP